MAKEKFDIIQSTCIPIQIDNCNTDLIIPARYLASTTRDPKFFGDAFMHDLRFDAEGNPVARVCMRLSWAVRTGVLVPAVNMPHGRLLVMAFVSSSPVPLLTFTATTFSTASFCLLS